MVSNCSEKDKEYPIKNNLGGIIFRLAATNENAQKCVFCVILMKCLKWPETYPKWIWDDLEHFEILRARWRADVRMRARFLTGNWSDGYWPWSCWIWMRKNFPLWRYDHVFKNTKWRLDDVMKTWWPWKGSCHVSWRWPLTVPKLNEIDETELELS